MMNKTERFVAMFCEHHTRGGKEKKIKNWPGMITDASFTNWFKAVK